MKRWIIDFTEMTGMDPLTRQRYILSVLDSNTKMLWTKAFRCKFAKYLHKLFSYKWAPEIVQSDNGGEFVAAIVLALSASSRDQRLHQLLPSSPAD
jgi:hypothetical protein